MPIGPIDRFLVRAYCGSWCVHGTDLLISTDVLQKRPSTPTLKRHTIEYLRTKTKSFDYTLSVIRELEQKTLEEIARLGGNAGLAKLMELLHIQPDDQ